MLIKVVWCHFAKHESTTGIEHIDGLYGYALALTQNRSDAEDLVQGSYVRAIRAMGRLRDDSNVKGWLFTILHNIWLNELRQIAPKVSTNIGWLVRTKA